jgi:hypothetical protein
LGILIDAICEQVKAYVGEKTDAITRASTERLDAHARRAESADQLLADLERRISQLEAKAEPSERRLRAVE